MSNNPKVKSEILDLIAKERARGHHVVAQELIRHLKSPLDMIRGRAETLKKNLEYHHKDNAQGILDQIDQLDSLIKSVEQMLATVPSTDSPVSVATVMNDILAFFQIRLSQSNIQVTNILPPDLKIMASESKIKNILTCIFIESMENLEKSSSPLRNIVIHSQKTLSYRILSIEDNRSQMISESDMNDSLAICRKICETVGWKFEVIPQKNQGVRMEIWIPHSSISASS